MLRGPLALGAYLVFATTLALAVAPAPSYGGSILCSTEGDIAGCPLQDGDSSITWSFAFAKGIVLRPSGGIEDDDPLFPEVPKQEEPIPVTIISKLDFGNLTGPLANLQFDDGDPVSAIPEPSTLRLVAIGLALFGFACTRRSARG